MKNKNRIFFRLNFKQHLSILISSSLILLPVEVQALPSGQVVVSGSANFDTTQTNMTITASNKAIINYNSFNINSNELVQFLQPSASSVVLNRVVVANPSSILGTLNANGRVFLVNPAGIYFGANSVVNANSFLATTLNITDKDFLNDNYNFQQMKDMASSYVIQKGSISVSPEGFVILAAPFVSSEGVIMAKAGHVVVGATDNFYIQFDTNGLIKYDYKATTTKDDAPIVIPKEYADSIIDNVINTDALNEAVKIVENGDKIELVGASGTAVVNSEISSDATSDKQAGAIDIQAQRKAFVLNGANIHADAQEHGNGGKINVYSTNLSYSDKGASYSADGGTIDGDGGYLEISAQDSVLFDGSKISLHRVNGKNGSFVIDPDNELVISSDSIYSGIDTTFLANKSIIVNDNVIVSTRDIGSGTDYMNDASQGDSGSLTIDAPQITVGSGSKLLTFADSGYSSGDLTLQAISNTADVGVQALSSITLNGATLKGGKITIKADANSQDHFDSTDEDHPVDPIEQALDFLSDIPTLPVGLSIAKSKATVDVGSGTSIDGSSIDITSKANSQGSVLTIFTAVGVGYGKSEASAQTTVKSGATLTSSGDINIKSDATSDNSVKVYTVGLGQGRGSTADLSLAYATTDTTSTAIVENGASVTSNTTLNVDAHTSKSITASASAGAYENGTVGAGVAITNSTSTTEANVGGTIDVQKLSITAKTENNLIKTASSAAVGSGAISGRVVGATNSVISSVEKYLSAGTPNTSAESGSKKPALSAAVSYADHSATTTASISDNAVVNVGDTTDISAENSYPIDLENGAKGLKTSATATIDSSDDDEKTYSVAGAVAITKLDNSVKAYVGEGSTLNSKGDINIKATTSMPYEVTWGKINKVSDITDYINSNIGLQNGFFTTWAQSNSQGTVAGAAGSVNYFHMTNDTEAYVDKNAKINKDQDSYGTLSLKALTDLQTVNLAGVFGWKILGSSGKSGLGGSYLDIQYDDTTKAQINDGAYAKTKAVSLSATTNTNNISIAEAGTKAEKYGAAGSFSYLRTNDTTLATITNADIIATGTSSSEDDLAISSDDTAKLFNVSGGIIKSSNVGIGASISINEITRDTESNLNGTTFENDGSMSISATNNGEIDAYSLASSVATALGVTYSQDSMAGQFGIGISGDVSLNRIDDTTTASIINSNNVANQNNAYDISLTAKDTTNIKSYAGSVSFTVSNKLSAGLAGSYAQNDITGTTKASIGSSEIYANALTLDASNTGTIDSYTASGSGAISGGVSVAIAGSISINNIANEVYAEVIDASDVTTNSAMKLSATDTPTIKTVAGAASAGGTAGIGASLSKNSINDKVYADIVDSTVQSGSSLDILSTENAFIDSVAASLAIATSGMAASAAIVINTISNSVKSWVDANSKEVSSDGDMNIKATDTENIETVAGDVTLSAGSAGFGASTLYNTIKNSIEAYINNAKVDNGGNIVISATSDKTIDSKAAGGSVTAGISAAGGVVINSIKDDIKSYIANSDISADGSISILANESNELTTMAGILSVGSTLGIGGAVLTNIIENSIDAYIDNSSVKAKGNAAVSTMLADGSGDTADTKGLDILAYGNEIINSNVANVSGGGSAAVAASVSVNLMEDNTNSYISNSHINEDNSDANSLQSVGVRAVSNSDILARAGGLAAGGEAGIGASSDTSIINNTNNAYIDGSYIYAKNAFEASSNGSERVNSTVVSGAFSGAASLAGSVAVVSVDNQYHAYTLNSNIASEGDLKISANDSTILGTQEDGTKSGILAGSLAIGGAAGFGGSVVVTTVKQDTQAHATDSTLNAKKETSILANNYSDFIVYAATTDVGAYVGAGGAVTIDTADTVAKAYTHKSASGQMLINQDDSYKTSSQDVTLQSDNHTSINSTPGAVGAGFVGASGSIDVATIHNTSLAAIGAYSKVNAGRDLTVRAVADKSITSNVAAGAGGAIGVAGAVSIANINTNIDSDSLDASDNTKDSTNTLVSKSAVGNQIGDSSTATDTKSELDKQTKAMNVDSEFDTDSSPSETTYAIVGDKSVVKVGGTTSVKTSDNAVVNSSTGVVAGGIVGVGGSVSIANIGADTRAYLGEDVALESGSLLINSNLETNKNDIISYAAAAGLVGLGAAVSKLSINYENDAYSDVGANIRTNSGDLTIEASSDLSGNSAEAYGAAAGAAAAGLVKADLSQKGTTQAIVSDSSSLNAANNLNIKATYDATGLSTISQAAAGGLKSGFGSLSTLSATPTLLASLGDDVSSNSGGDTIILASSLASLSSEADGMTPISGVTFGVSKAKASWTPTLKSHIGSNTHINTNNLNMTAYENMDSSGNSLTGNTIQAKAFSSAGSLLKGAAGSLSEASRDSNVRVTIGNTNQINTNQDIVINSKAFGKTDASSNGDAYGALAAGFTGSTATSKAQVSSIIGKRNILMAGRDIKINAYARSEATSDSFGGAGGLLTDNGTKSTASIDKSNAYIDIKEDSQLLANNGDISLLAKGYIYAKALSSIVTDSFINNNESEANVKTNQDIKVDIEKNSKLEAKNINIAAYGYYLHAIAKANSKTIAADSTSKAYANTDVTSSTNINIQTGATLNGAYSINIKSSQDEANLLTSAKSYGEIKAGVTGTVAADAHNNAVINAYATNDDGTSFTTKSLSVETYAPGQNDDTYKIDAVAKANTVVNWVLTKVDELVKKTYKIPLLGWLFKWVWHKVEKYVKQITHSDTSSTTSGDYSSTSLLTMKGDIYQKTSVAQTLNIAADGTMNSSGDITATASGDDIIVNDLINHDQGDITLKSNGDITGSSDIYLDNKYPDVTVNNLSNKNLEINNINVVSDNANKPNVEVDYGDTNTFDSTFHTQTPSHTVHINNEGTGNILFNGVIDNYAGDTTVYNQYGNIFANSGALLKTKTLNMNAYRGSIGSGANAVEIELQKSDASNPTLTTNSFYDTYLGLKIGEITGAKEPSDYMIDGVDLSNLKADGNINLNIHEATVHAKYYVLYGTLITLADGTEYMKIRSEPEHADTPALSNYYIKNIDATGNINIDADNGVSLILDGNMRSGMTDQVVTLNQVIDPYSRDARYVASQTADTLYLTDITQPGGSIKVNLKGGLFTGAGNIDTMDGHTHITVNNLSDKNVNFQEVNANSRSDNGFYINGIKQQSHDSIVLGGFGYEKGAININSKNGGAVQLGGNIYNQSGSTNIVGNNGIYNMATNLIDSYDMMLDTSAGGSVGTYDNPIYTAGIVSVKSAADANLYAQNELTLANVNAQNAYLSSDGTIKGSDSTTPNVTADSVELRAQGDINSLADNFVTLSANTIAANSVNGEIKLNNNKGSVIGTVGTTTGLHAANDLNFISGGTLHQVKDAEIASDNSNVALTSSGDMSFDHVTAPQRVTLISQNGAISQDGDSAADIVSDEAVLHASNGIGSDDALETTINILDAENSTANDIALSNHGTLTLNSVSNGHGDVKITSDAAIKGSDSTTPNVTADGVELRAQGDINSLADNFVTLSANTIAANSVNGEIKLNNNKGSVIGTVGTTTGLHAANDLNFISGGTLHQVKDAEIASDNSNVALTSSGDMSFDHVTAPQRVTLISQNGAISQDGDSAADIVSDEAVLHASNGIGSDDALDTAINTLDAENSTANDIALSNHGSLKVDDLDSDGYALYNGGGAIRITTDGAFTQATPTSIFANGNIDVAAQNNIFVSDMKSLANLKLHSYDGDILGDGRRNPNISVKDQLVLYADNGVVGTPANPISIVRENGGVIIEADIAKDYLSTYVFGANAPTNNFLDEGLTAFNNRIVSGTLIEQYYGMLFNYTNKTGVHMPQNRGNSAKNAKESHLISMNGAE